MVYQINKLSIKWDKNQIRITLIEEKLSVANKIIYITELDEYIQKKVNSKHDNQNHY